MRHRVTFRRVGDAGLAGWVTDRRVPKSDGKLPADGWDGRGAAYRISQWKGASPPRADCSGACREHSVCMALSPPTAAVVRAEPAAGFRHKSLGVGQMDVSAPPRRGGAGSYRRREDRPAPCEVAPCVAAFECAAATLPDPAEVPMLRNLKDLMDYRIGATDGVTGRVRDYYFDDQSWVIRYLVVELNADRQVLLSPIVIGQPNGSDQIFPVARTRAQIRSSPDFDTHRPVSRQHEMGYAGYYGYGDYWGGGGLWGAGIYPDELQGRLQGADAGSDAGQPVDPHLRSVNEISRYYVHASDGDLGHVESLLIDERTWAIRFIIVNTSNWWLGHSVLVAPDWIERIDWPESHVWIDLTRQAIKAAPAYDPARSLDRAGEAVTYAHYGRDGYRPQDARHIPARPRP